MSGARAAVRSDKQSEAEGAVTRRQREESREASEAGTGSAGHSGHRTRPPVHASDLGGHGVRRARQSML